MFCAFSATAGMATLTRDLDCIPRTSSYRNRILKEGMTYDGRFDHFSGDILGTPTFRNGCSIKYLVSFELLK